MSKGGISSICAVSAIDNWGFSFIKFYRFLVQLWPFSKYSLGLMVEELNMLVNHFFQNLRPNCKKTWGHRGSFLNKIFHFKLFVLFKVIYTKKFPFLLFFYPFSILWNVFIKNFIYRNHLQKTSSIKSWIFDFWCSIESRNFYF